MRLFIGVPAYRGLQCVPFLNSLEATVRLLAEWGVSSEFHMVTQSPYVQTARNTLVRQFLASRCDRLLFLDDDISWEAGDVLRLLNAPFDAVAGVYVLRQDEPNYPVVLRCDDEGQAYSITPKPLYDGDPAQTYLIATRAATGFMLLSRAVFTQIQEAYPEREYDDWPANEPGQIEVHFDFFPQGVHNRRWIGEDFAFCNLWSGIGGSVYIVPDMTLWHHGVDEDGNPKAWRGNLAEYLRGLPGGIEHGEAAA